MKIQEYFLFKTYRQIKTQLPGYVMKSMTKLIPAYLFSSVFEIFSLVILFPAINTIIDPASIEKVSYLHIINQRLGFTSTIHFVIFLLSAITFFFILKNILLRFIYKLQSDVAFELSQKIAFEKFVSYLNKPYSFHAENNTALLLRNFAQIPFELISYSVLPFFNILNELLILILIISGIAFYDPLLFLSLVLFATPFFFIYDRIYRKKLKAISEQRNSAHAGMYKSGMQSMEGFREIVVFNKKEFFKSNFKKHLKIFSETTGDSYRMNIFSPKIVETAAVLCIFFIFIFGFLLNKNLNALAQFLIIFSIASYRIIPSINKIILSFNYIKSSEYVYDYFEKSDFVPQETKPEQASSESLNFREKIEIKNLLFQFPGKAEPVLRNINIIIPKSKTIGIIGPSGSGKTTLLNILLRLYEEQQGGIYVDGIRVDRRNLSKWYELVSYVPQNTTLLDGTIAENIAFGIERAELNTNLLSHVIEKSLLTEFAGNLPQGVNTQIGEKGIKISGGQRQRIGIARALYHGGEILIFDEATSSLDYETERALTDSIQSLAKRRDLTIIIVAHRLQTLQFCDIIFKLENGSIVSSTTYSELEKINKVI